MVFLGTAIWLKDKGKEILTVHDIRKTLHENGIPPINGIVGCDGGLDWRCFLFFDLALSLACFFLSRFFLLMMIFPFMFFWSAKLALLLKYVILCIIRVIISCIHVNDKVSFPICFKISPALAKRSFLPRSIHNE